MKRFLSVALCIGAVVLAGCAGVPQAPVAFAPSSVSAASVRVGVAMAPLPKADTFFPGADCLLCIAAASVANSSLTAHTKTLPVDDLATLKNEMADLLRKKGATVKVIADEIRIADLPGANNSGPNVAKKDFTGLKGKYEIDKLLVINVATAGMWRTYSAYFPTAEPKAIVAGLGFMVDLSSNTYEWYEPLNVLKAAEGKWDEPPKFPGLTNAYFQAIEVGKDALKKPFAP
jgi:hypothetical protein